MVPDAMLHTYYAGALTSPEVRDFESRNLLNPLLERISRRRGVCKGQGPDRYQKHTTDSADAFRLIES